MARTPDRRTFLRDAIAGATAGFGGCTRPGGPHGGTATRTPTTDETPPPEPASDREPLPGAVGLETITDDPRPWVDIAFLPDADMRYLATRRGKIMAHGAEGLGEEPVIDLIDDFEFRGEMGLLGIELHPEFADTRRLFVRYSSFRPREGTPDDYSHTFVLAEFDVGDDGTRVDPDSERTVMEIPQPQANHNAGDIAFGPDGYLYVPTGDGGGAGDTGLGHPDDWYDENEGGNGQNTIENLLGGILRLDIDAAPTEHYRTDDDAPAEPGGDGGYAIPGDNPLVDLDDHRDEYYAWGLRNPWRLSFDDGTLYVGDVGQASWEEINVVERGGNYGWNVKEGRHCFDPDDTVNHPIECPSETPDHVRGGEPLVDPIIEYPNAGPSAGEVNGTTVIGGYVYRGTALPVFEGRYVFGDLAHDGRLFVATPLDAANDEETWPVELVDVAGDPDDEIGSLYSFGRDENDELYVLGNRGVHRIVPPG